MDQAASLLGNVKNDSCFPTLTFKERMTGFAICFALGLVIDIFTFGSLIRSITDTSKFAMTYTVGNIVSLAGTSFLVGPAQQCKNMLKPARIVVSIIYIGAMIGTIVTAILGLNVLIILACIIVQFCAFVWYVATYIPYGTKCLTMCLKKAVKTDG